MEPTAITFPQGACAPNHLFRPTPKGCPKTIRLTRPHEEQFAIRGNRPPRRQRRSSCCRGLGSSGVGLHGVPFKKAEPRYTIRRGSPKSSCPFQGFHLSTPRLFQPAQCATSLWSRHRKMTLAPPPRVGSRFTVFGRPPPPLSPQNGGFPVGFTCWNRQKWYPQTNAQIHTRFFFGASIPHRPASARLERTKTKDRAAMAFKTGTPPPQRRPASFTLKTLADL